MFLADSASTVQPWVWVLVFVAIAMVIFGILADLGERPSAGATNDGTTDDSPLTRSSGNE